MPFTRIYYQFKRFIPRRVGFELRRLRAASILKKCGAFWPIQASSGLKPDGWPGWPDEKRFSFVLTHDVEGLRGLDRVQRLAQLEIELGFRSSFNFVPEGTYEVPSALRGWLTDAGFEVGVHDLHHDGHLFSSFTSFRRKAGRINAWLNEWNAVGFRAGFMVRNLDWIPELNILYDASTFDVDPFEPQPDGAGTIFPFWIDCYGGPKGYMELPYTMPQDSTLFLVLRKRSIDIWKQKVDWIAERGGMALLNVHPDYIRFDGSDGSLSEYPSAYYRELLEYVRKRYDQQFWQPLAREAAAYCIGFKPSHSSAVDLDNSAPGVKVDGRPAPEALPGRMGSPKRVCMITHSHYESDNRVLRYAEALVQRGDSVEVFALRRNPEMPKEEVISGVRVFRIQDRFSKGHKSRSSFLWPLLQFLVVASWRVTQSHWRLRYDLLHVHNIPDFLVFAAWYPKLTGTPIILDIHDMVPEFFVSKFGASKNAAMFWALQLMERISAAFADHVIIANHLWFERYTARSAPLEKCSVFINHVDSRIFQFRPRGDGGWKPVVLFPGGLEWHQGVDVAIRAFKELLPRIPQAEFHIYGDGTMKPELVELANNLGVNGSVRFFEPLPIREIADVMGRAGLGVVAKRSDSFGNEAYSTKIMEFMSVGVPVVASNTAIDRYYMNDSVVRFFESGNISELTEAMHEVLTNRQLRCAMVERAFEYASRNNWQNRKSEYFRLVDSLCSQK